MAKQFVRNQGGGIPKINDNLDNASSVQTFIKSQIYMMGYSFGVNAGPSPINKIVLSGSARRLFGFVLYVTEALKAEDDIFSLTLNNENIVTTCLWKAFSPTSLGNFKTQMFFAIPRPLSGSDSLNIGWNATSAKTIYPIFYLSDF